MSSLGCPLIFSTDVDDFRFLASFHPAGEEMFAAASPLTHPVFTGLPKGYVLKPRHEFIDAGAELPRLYPIGSSSTSNHAASRPDETLNAWEAEHEYLRTYSHPTQSASIRTKVNKIVTLLVNSKKHGEAVMYTTFDSPRDHGMPLVTRTPQALKRGRRDLPNRVNRDEVCRGCPPLVGNP
jgi:hypothetical protein